MASEAQVLANRLNAQKSTGPRTPEGKAVASQNAVKHGLLARRVVIGGEDPGEFEFYRDQMLGELAPAGPMESMLAERVVSLSWRLQRAERLQTEAFDALIEKDAVSPFVRLTQSLRAKGAAQPQDDPNGADGGPALGGVVVKDFSNARVLDRLLMYERRIEHSLYKTMAELQRLRLLREVDGPAQEPVCSVPGWGERPRSPEEVGRGRPTYEETPHGVTMNVPAAGVSPPAAKKRLTASLPADQSCKTNPISPDPIEGQVPCGTGLMAIDTDYASEKTKPISEAETACPACAGVPEPEPVWRSCGSASDTDCD